MALNGIKGNYPLSLIDQGRESSAELLTMPAQACVVILSLYCRVPPHLLKVLWVDGLWTLRDIRQSGVPSPSPSHGTPKGPCSFWAKEMYGTSGWISFSRVTQRCIEGQGEDRIMSLSHRYIKEVAEVASLVGCTLHIQNCFVWFGFCSIMLATMCPFISFKCQVTLFKGLDSLSMGLAGISTCSITPFKHKATEYLESSQCAGTLCYWQ